jgi:hypothetical protein
MNRYNGVMSINNAVMRIHGGLFKTPHAPAEE